MKPIQLLSIALILGVIVTHVHDARSAEEDTLSNVHRQIIELQIAQEELQHDSILLQHKPLNASQWNETSEQVVEYHPPQKLTLESLTEAEKKIIFKESSNRTNAKNSHSTAFGLGQLIKSNRIKYASKFNFHPDTVDEHEQLLMFQEYVADRYGTAENALQFHVENGYY